MLLKLGTPAQTVWEAEFWARPGPPAQGVQPAQRSPAGAAAHAGAGVLGPGSPQRAGVPGLATALARPSVSQCSAQWGGHAGPGHE